MKIKAPLQCSAKDGTAAATAAASCRRRGAETPPGKLGPLLNTLAVGALLRDRLIALVSAKG
jgi:hypothetical protein